MTPIRGRHLLALLLLSSATLLLEMALTRLLSVALWYHFGFFVVSTALLGFGASGVALSALPRLRETPALDTALARLAALFAAAVTLAWVGGRALPFDPFSLGRDWRQWLLAPLFEGLWALPFFAAGLAIALLLSRGGAQVNRLYGADLAGAAAGCGLLAAVMPRVGGPGTLAVVVGLALCAAAVFLGARRWAAVAAAGAAACVALAPHIERVLPVRITPSKLRPPTTPVWSGWNTLSLIEVFDRRADPELGTPVEHELCIDGCTAVTGNWDLGEGLTSFLRRPPLPGQIDSGLAYPNVASPRVLIIGSGAGIEIVDALRRHASRVVGVEINPLIIRLGRDILPDSWGHLYERPEVAVIAEEGRSYVRRSAERFDAIISVHTISNAAQASGALSLAENYVLTREAFGEYLAHLARGGILYFTRPENQALRLLATIREAWEAAGRHDLEDSVVVFRLPWGGALRQKFAGRAALLAGVVVKDGVLTASEWQTIRQRARIGDATFPDGRFDPPELLYSPFEAGGELVYRELLTTPDLPGFYERQPAAVQPVTDDRPFFNQRARWSRLGWVEVKDVFTQGTLGRLALEDRPIAEVTLLALLAQSALLSGLCILWPLRRFGRTGLPRARSLSALGWYAALGLGFILTEMALLQRYALYLGQPVFTLAAVLAALLFWSGLGSVVAEKRAAAAPFALLRIAVPALIGALALTAMGTRALFSATLGLPFGARVTLAVLSLAPLGLLLGVPFSTSLRALQDEDRRLLPWAWGVNGFFTVLGTSIGLVAGMTVGFEATLALAGACYAAGLVTFLRLQPGRLGATAPEPSRPHG